MENVITVVILLAIAGGAVFYLIRAKKRGGCVGCPCQKKCGGKCSSCSDEKKDKK